MGFILGTFVGAFVACLSIALVGAFSDDDPIKGEYGD
jgi:hypothetical protein